MTEGRGGRARGPQTPSTIKVAIVVLADTGTNEALGRAVSVLASAIKEAGEETTIVFDRPVPGA